MTLCSDRPISPTAIAERFVTLDVLRGFALLGILLINVQIFAGSPIVAWNMPLRVVAQTGPHPMIDGAAMLIQWLFFEGKMRAIFTMLFGAGTVLLLDRVGKRHGDGRAADIFHRRNMWLLLFGLIHGVFIWTGDVLFIYSMTALLFLYPFRRVAAQRLIRIGLPLALIGGTIGIGNVMHLDAAWPTAQLEESARQAIATGQQMSREEADAHRKALARRRDQIKALNAPTSPPTSYTGSVAAAAIGFPAFVFLIFKSGWLLETLGLLIAGMGLFKCGFLTGQLSSATYIRVALAGYALSMSITFIGLLHSADAGFSSSVTTVWMMLPYEVQSLSGALANASVIVLIVKTGRFAWAQTGLCAVGRMAFSNYLLTSVICQALFPWIRILPYGGMEHHQLMILTMAVWTFNVAFSVFWLRHFTFGPFEWAWRSLTYWKAQPIRIAARQYSTASAEIAS